MYPPGGYISWHNNANASAYNLVFTWSESGNGYFKYIDGETKKEIVEGIAKALGISYQDIAGLEKSPKADLKVLVATLTQEEAQ